MSDTMDLERSAELLRVLGHPMRLALLTSLGDGERAVGDLEVRTGIRQPALSQQLGILRNAGLVTTRRAAKQIFYSIQNATVAEVSALLHRLTPSPERASSATKPDCRLARTAAAFARIG